MAFERRIAGLWEAGELRYLIHLSGGNEDELIRIFNEVQPGDWVFSTHRNHYHYLLSGGSPERLEELIRTGNSMFVFEKMGTGYRFPRNSEVNFLSSSVLAGTSAIAAGVAWQIKQSTVHSPQSTVPHVWCFLGDGEDEGHFYEAVHMVDGWSLPCTFVIEDNNRSVDTDVRGRRGAWYVERWKEIECVRRYLYEPTYPHAGSGCRHHIQFKR